MVLIFKISENPSSFPMWSPPTVPLKKMFVNYRCIGLTGDPDVRFSLHITNIHNRVDQTASLGDDTFVNADTRKALLKLGNLDRYEIVLRVESGGLSP